MAKTYRFIDCTNQLAEARDENGNHWVFLIDDNSNQAYLDWAALDPRPEIELFNEPCPPDPEQEL